MLREILRARDDPRRRRRREAHALPLVELGVLKGGEALDLVQERRGDAVLRDEQTLGEHRGYAGRHRARRTPNAPSSGGRARPRLRVLVVVCRLGRANAEDRPRDGRIAGDPFDRSGVDPPNGREDGPLLVVGVGVHLVVEEDRVALLPRAVLKGQRDEVAETCARHRVLARKEPVVRVHAELVTRRHRLRDEVAAHFACGPRGDGLREEEPDVRAVAGSRSLDQGGQPEPPRRLHERANVLLPRGLVEVGGEKPARLVSEHRVDAHHVLAAQVLEQRRIIHGPERLVRTIAALHLRQLAYAGDELVRASGRIASLARLLADEARRIQVVAAAEELPEQLHLLRRGSRCGGWRGVRFWADDRRNG